MFHRTRFLLVIESVLLIRDVLCERLSMVWLCVSIHIGLLRAIYHVDDGRNRVVVVCPAELFDAFTAVLDVIPVVGERPLPVEFRDGLSVIFSCRFRAEVFFAVVVSADFVSFDLLVLPVHVPALVQFDHFEAGRLGV